MKIVRKLLTASEITPASLRYNSDCDCVQQTPDGGTTWIDVPELDPRRGAGYRMPPNASADPQCNSAANMVAYLQSLIAADLAATNVVSLVSLWFEILLLVFPIGILADLLLIVAGAIATIGSTAIETAFTPEVYDALLCTFDCNIGADGQMSDAQLAAIYVDVAANYDATVQAVFGAHSSTVGAVGWSNAGAIGAITDADCSSCECSTCNALYDFTLGDELGWYVAPTSYTGVGEHGSWTGTGWISDFASYCTCQAFFIAFNCTNPSFSSINIGYTAVTTGTLYAYLLRLDGSGLIEIGGVAFDPGTSERDLTDLSIAESGEWAVMIAATTSDSVDGITLEKVGLNTPL